MRNNRHSGMTLIEILVVVTLIAIILGMSSAFISQFNKKLEFKTTAQQLSVTLRTAKSFSLEARTSSTVEIDLQENAFSVKGSRVSGYWHFEDAVTTGAFRKDGTIENGTLTKGKIGKGIFLNGKDCKIDLGLFQRFGIRDGFAISLWIYPYLPSTKAQTIWQLGDYYSLQLKNRFLILQHGEEQTILKNFVVPIRQWTHLSTVVDLDSISIYADDILLQTQKVPLVVLWEENLLLGIDFHGTVDEASLRALYIVESYTIPDTIELTTTTKSIVFNQQGALSPIQHLAPVSLALKDKYSDRNLEIQISLMGNIEIIE